MIKFRKNPDQISKQRNDTENLNIEKQQEKTARGTTRNRQSYRAIRKTDTEQGQQKTKNTAGGQPLSATKLLKETLNMLFYDV